MVLGELGGHDEYSLVDALKSGQINKPVVAWVSGTCAKLFKSEVQFGHAGAKSGGASESAQASRLRANFNCQTCRHTFGCPALNLIGSQTLNPKNAKPSKTLIPTTYQTTLPKLQVLSLGFCKTLTVKTDEK